MSSARHVLPSESKVRIPGTPETDYPLSLRGRGSQGRDGGPRTHPDGVREGCRDGTRGRGVFTTTDVAGPTRLLLRRPMSALVVPPAVAPRVLPASVLVAAGVADTTIRPPTRLEDGGTGRVGDGSWVWTGRKVSQGPQVLPTPHLRLEVGLDGYGSEVEVDSGPQPLPQPQGPGLGPVQELGFRGLREGSRQDPLRLFRTRGFQTIDRDHRDPAPE